jgi:cellulose synthase operon protein C
MSNTELVLKPPAAAPIAHVAPRLPTGNTTLDQVKALYDDGRLLQAWQLSQALGPLREWQGTHARILAGRLASQLSADRLGDALILRAWRADRRDPEAILYGAMALRSFRGSLASLDLLNTSGILESDSPVRWDAVGYAAWLHATFRDFETADAMIARALDGSETAWMWTQRAAIDEMADRYDQAMEATRHAMSINPRSRSAIQYSASFLSMFERDEEAIELLRNTLTTIESPRIAAQLAGLQYEKGHYQAALTSLDRYEELTPIKDKGAASWLAGRRCDLYSGIGDRPRALEQAKLATASAFYKQIAMRLEEAPPDARRVMLPVGFVRQHHMTCAPATMAALSRFWARPADHLEVAESICYDGTPNHSQRQWAIESGWHVREFTATWDAARALLDAGIPFTLSTVHPGSAHLQAVIGYDAARGTLLIRDPYERIHTEFAERPFFEGYRATGPRGMAMVPPSERARLDAIDLPEVGLHDIAHAVQDALVAYDRDGAVAKVTEITTDSPGHRIEIGVRRSLANYDGDLAADLHATEELLAKFPDDVNLRLAKASLLRQLATPDVHLAYVREQCNGKASHSLLQLQLARILQDDARCRTESLLILRRLARNGCRSDTLSTLADTHWNAGEYPRAVELYRLASTLEETDEGQARAYFRAARMVRGEERAIAFLQHRVRRLGHLSAQPAMTLYDCLEELDRASEARTVFAEALQTHPDDGTMLLFAARIATTTGDSAKADAFLDRARNRSHETEWLRAGARIHQQRGELAPALQRWKQVVAKQPLDLSAQRAVAGLKYELGGRAAAVEYLRTATGRFPHHQGLHELFIEWLDEAPLDELEGALHRLLDINPANAWAQRQLALTLAKQRRFADAHQRMAIAKDLAPNTLPWHNVQGNIFMLEGRRSDAQNAFRNALRLAVDSEYAINQLLEACTGIEERRDALSFVFDEMKRQVIYGDALLVYQRHARDTVEPATLAASLDEARSARPDLWQAWVACLRQQIAMQQHDRAKTLCDEAIARFPVLPRLHIERADIARVAGDRTAAYEALTEALRLSPGWSIAARKLADVMEANGDFAGSRIVIEAALRHSPADPILHGYLGHTLWQLGRRSEAIAQLEQAATLDLDYGWAWQTFKQHTREEGQPDSAIVLARRLADQRPGDMRAWLAVARVADDQQETLAALDRAISLAPLALAPTEMKLDTLIELKRFDEALRFVDHTAWGLHPPVALQAKACRIMAVRNDVPAAIARMERVLAADPNHHFGWELLADWHCALENWTAYLAATREMCRISPNDAGSLGYLADALTKAEPNTDVRPHLRRALHLKPDYYFAGFMLFDLEFQADELDAAEATVNALTAQGDTGYTRWRAIRLATKRQNRDHALDLYRMMWAMNEESLDPFQRATQTLVGAGWTHDVLNVLGGVLTEPDVNPHAGTVWIERCIATPFSFNRFPGLAEVLANGEAGQRAARALLEYYGENEKVRPLLRLVGQHAKLFAHDDMTHGTVGYALLQLERRGEVLAWYRDWRTRAGAPQWSLLNYVGALRSVERDAEAAEVGHHALTRPADHTVGPHSIWLALDAAFAGHYAEARRLLADLDAWDINDYFRFHARLAQALISIGPEHAPLSDAAYADAAEILTNVCKLTPRILEQPILQKRLMRTLWRIACKRNTGLVGAMGSWLYLGFLSL